MTRRFYLVAGACFVAVGLGFPTGSAAQSGSPFEPSVVSADSTCRLGLATSLDVVLLIDQSTSLKPPADRPADRLEALGEGLDATFDRLGAAVSKSVTVKVGVVSFGTKATILRAVEPFDQTNLDKIAKDLVDQSGLEDYTDYSVALEKALSMFENSAAQSTCRILLWFTDGKVDLPRFGADNVPAEGNLLLDSVCGPSAGIENLGIPLAQRARTLDVTSYALLLNKGSKDFNFSASVNAMRALTGDVDKVVLPNSDLGDLLPQCERFVTGELKPTRPGRVVVDANQLRNQLFVLINEAVGGAEVLECPTEVALDLGITSGPLPSAALIERLDVTLLGGGPIGALSAVTSEGETTLTTPTSENSSVPLAADAPKLTGGWKLKVQGTAGSPPPKVCIQLTRKKFVDPIVVTANTRDTTADQQVVLTVDWGTTFGTSDLGDVVATWKVDALDDPNFGALSEVGDILGSTKTVSVTSGHPGEKKTLRSIRLSIVPKGVTGGFAEGIEFTGKLKEQVSLSPDKDAPKLVCNKDWGLKVLHQEVPKSQIPLQAKVSCVVTPPEQGTASLTLDPTGLLGASAVKWVLRDERSGAPVLLPKVLKKGDSPLTVRLSTDEAFANEDLLVRGDVVLSLRWILDKPYPAQTARARVDIDLIKRSDLGRSILIAALATAVAALISLLLLRLSNSRYVRLPDAVGFYAVSAPITLGVDATGVPIWSGRDVLKQLTSQKLEPVRSVLSGRSLEHKPIRIERVMPPWWRPFKAPTAEVRGAAYSRVKPGSRGTATTPTSFSSLTVVSTESVTRPDRGSQVDALVTMLIPRSTVFSVEESALRDVDQLVGDLVNGLPLPAEPSSRRSKLSDADVSASPPIVPTGGSAASSSSGVTSTSDRPVLAPPSPLRSEVKPSVTPPPPPPPRPGSSPSPR